MDPKSEALSLKGNPLPEEIPDSEVAPTTIAILGNGIENLENEILKLNGRLRNLYNDRDRLIERAVKLGKMEDADYKIIESVTYGNRVCDPKKLKESNKETWELYEAAYNKKAQQDAEDIIKKAKENINEKVLLGVADKIFGKKIVDLYSQSVATVKYKVEKK